MRLLKPLLLSGLLAIGSANAIHAANVHALIEPAAEKLDYKFFYWLIDKEDLTKAYAQAQKEDFDAGSHVLFTPEMLTFFKLPKKDWEDKLGDLGALWNLEGELKSLNDESSAALLQEWRYSFLSHMMDYMRAQNMRKPIFKAMMLNELKSDSNVKRRTDEDLSPGDPSGKSDGQHMVFLNLKWMPLANNENFNKKNEFEQGFNVIRMHQFSHEENQVAIFDTESKYTRKIGGALEDFSIAYRIQNFGLGSVGSRDTHSKFNSHRFKAEWSLMPMKLGGVVDSTKTNLALAYTRKDQLNDVDKNASTNSDKDANEIRLTWDQNFNYKVKGHAGTVVTTVEYNDYSADNNTTGDYDYLQLKLKESHAYKVNYLKEPLRVSEEIGWRSKSWDNNPTSISEEDIWWLQAKASTKICPSLDASLTFKQSWIDIKKNSVGENAAQTIVALGLMWSTP
jgi:hypothetical protein